MIPLKVKLSSSLVVLVSFDTLLNEAGVELTLNQNLRSFNQNSMLHHHYYRNSQSFFFFVSSSFDLR